jgi:hypothetical protein
MAKSKNRPADEGGNPQEAAHSTLLARIHEQLYHHVGEAVEPVTELEKTWSPSEMTRIYIYIYI